MNDSSTKSFQGSLLKKAVSLIRQYGIYIGGLLLLGLFGVLFCLIPPRFSFSLDAIEGEKEVTEVAALVDSINDEFDSLQIENTKAPALALAQMVQLPANSSATELKDFLRAHDKNRVTLNGVILELQSSVGSGSLARWKKLPTEQCAAEIEQQLRSLRRSRLQKSLSLLVKDMDGGKILAKNNQPSFPQSTNFFRSCWIWLRGVDFEDGIDWAENLRKSFEEQLAPRHQWYQRVANVQINRLQDSESCFMFESQPQKDVMELSKDRALWDVSVILKLRNQVGITEITKEKRDKVRKDDLFYSPDRKVTESIKVADSSFALLDLGLRVFNLPLVPDAQGTPVIEQLPGVDVLMDRVQAGLSQLGLSNEVMVTQARAEWLSKDYRDGLKLVVTCAVRSFPSVKRDLSLTIKSKTTWNELAPLLRQEQIALKQDLLAYLLNTDSVSGVKYRLVNQSDLQCTIDLGNGLSLHLPGQLAEDCKLYFRTLPSVEEQQAIIKLVVARISESNVALKLAAPLLRLQSISFEPGKRIAIEGVAKLDGLASQQKSAAELFQRFILSPGPIITMEPSPQWLAAVGESITELAVLPGDASVNFDAETALSETLGKLYPKLADRVVFSGFDRIGGNIFFRTQMRMGDWPDLDLGLNKIASEGEAESLVQQLLSEESIKEAIAKQYGASAVHAKYGPMVAQFEKWTPEDGALALKVHPDWPAASPALQRLLNEALSWVEVIDYIDGKYVAIGADFVARKLDPAISAIELELARSVSAYSGGLFQVVVRRDRTAFPTGWLQTSPLAIGMDVSLVVPELGAGGGGRLTWDANGLKLNELEAQWPSTLTLPNFAISDPAIAIQLDDVTRAALLRGEWDSLLNSTVRVSGRITPPTLPIPRGQLPTLADYDLDGVLLTEPFRPDNPWLHVINMKAAFGGSLGKAEISSQTNLNLIGRPVAEGNLSWAIRRGVIQGNLAGELEVGGIGGRANQELYWDRDTLKTDTAMRFLGVQLDNTLSYQPEREANAFSVDGTGSILDLTSVQWRGEVAKNLGSPALSATGTINLILATYQWEAWLHHTRGKGVRFWRVTDDGKTVEVTLPYIPQASDMEMIEEMLQEVEREVAKEGEATQVASTEEQELFSGLTQPFRYQEAEQADPVPPIGGRKPNEVEDGEEGFGTFSIVGGEQRDRDREKSQGKPKSSDGNTAGESQSEDGSEKSEEQSEQDTEGEEGEQSASDAPLWRGELTSQIEDGRLIVRDQTKTDIINILATDLGIDDGVVPFMQVSPDDKDIVLILVDRMKRGVRVAVCSKEEVRKLEDLTEKTLSSLDPIWLKQERGEKFAEELTIQLRAIFDAGTSHLTGQLISITQKPWGVFVQSTLPDGREMGSVFGNLDHPQRVLWLVAERFPKEYWTEETLSAIASVGCPVEFGSCYLTDPAAETSSVPKFFINQTSLATSLLYSDPTDPAKTPLTVQWVLSDQWDGVFDAIEDLRKIVKIAESNTNLVRAYRGPEGICVVGQESLILSPKGRSQVETVPRSSLIRWPESTARFLPDSLAREADREQMSLEKWAFSIVRSFKDERKDANWGVAPMGLMMRLAVEEKATSK